MNQVDVLDVEPANVDVRHEEQREEGGRIRLSDGAVRELCSVFKLLADETRFRIILHLLEEGELNVTQLCERLGQSQPAVSHHLALLRVARLIELRREGKHNYYSLSQERLVDLFENVFPLSSKEPGAVNLPGIRLSYRRE